MELKKSYKGLVFWVLGYTTAIFCPLFFTHDTALVIRLTMNITTAGMALLCGIILKTEAVYWFNGTEYEEAVKAGTERRKAFARKHFDVFFWFATLYFLFSVLMHLLQASFWIDFSVGCIGLIAAAISTIRFKL
ncbi:MAG: hypothetical protein E7324_03110 [Clostridiales bacterium]|nr:hypothetical protein [Clostridiales bacterium]